MTEQLQKSGPHGSELLSEILNLLFEPIIDKIHISGGFIASFAGDAFTAIFPTDRCDCNTLSDVACFIRDHVETLDLTEYNIQNLSVKSGIACGNTSWSITRAAYHHYHFRGEAIDKAAESEHLCSPGDIVIQRDLYEKSDNAENITLADPDHVLFPGNIKNISTVKSENHKKIQNNLSINSLFYPESIAGLKRKMEFRDVSTVFISFSSGLTDDDLHTLISDVSSLTEKYRGYMNKVDFGDKGGIFLCVFGAPDHHEHHTQSALDMFIELSTKHSRIRAGVTSGTVFAGFLGSSARAEYTVLGDLVNIAARLCMKAEKGELLLDKTVKDKIEWAYILEYKGSEKLKGKQDTRDIYSLVKKRDIIEKFYQNRFIDRKKEMNSIISFYESLQGRENALIFIHGPAGIGKSRFAHEFVKYAETTHHSHGIFLQTNPFSKFTNTPLHLLVSFYFNKIKNNSFESECESMGFSAQETHEIKNSLSEKDKCNLEPGLKHRCIKEVIIKLAQKKDLLIIIEDFRYIDNETLMLIREITASDTESSVVFIINSRRRKDINKLSTDDLMNCVVEIKPFTYEHIKGMISDITQAVPGDDIIAFLENKTHGNPLQIMQILSFLKEKDLYFIRKGRQHDHLMLKDISELDSLTSPDNIAISKIDSLPDRERELVLNATVLGRKFSKALLQYMSDTEIDPIVQSLEQKGILYDLNGKDIIFRSHGFVDTVYNLQSKKDLSRKHAIAAEYLKEQGMTELTGFHLLKAEREKEAFPYIKQTALQAMKEYNTDKASYFFAESTEIAEKNRMYSELFSLAGNYTLLLNRLGRYEEEITLYNKCINIASEINDMKNEIIFRYYLAHHKYVQGETAEAEQKLSDLKHTCEKLKIYDKYTNIVIYLGRI